MKIAFITCLLLYIGSVLFMWLSFKKEFKKPLKFQDEDDAFVTIMMTIFKSRSEEELRKTIAFISLYHDQFNNESDVDWLIEMYDKRMQELTKTKTTI